MRNINAASLMGRDESQAVRLRRLECVVHRSNRDSHAPNVARELDAPLSKRMIHDPHIFSTAFLGRFCFSLNWQKLQKSLDFSHKISHSIPTNGSSSMNHIFSLSRVFVFALRIQMASELSGSSEPVGYHYSVKSLDDRVVYVGDDAIFNGTSTFL